MRQDTYFHLIKCTHSLWDGVKERVIDLKQPPPPPHLHSFNFICARSIALCLAIQLFCARFTIKLLLKKTFQAMHSQCAVFKGEKNIANIMKQQEKRFTNCKCSTQKLTSFESVRNNMRNNAMLSYLRLRSITAVESVVWSIELANYCSLC